MGFFVIQRLAESSGVSRMAVSRICYATREQVKRAGNIHGAEQHARVDRIIQAVSKAMETDTRTWFVPRSYTATFPWCPGPLNRATPPEILLPADLLSLSNLTVAIAGQTPIVVPSTSYRLQAKTSGAPYTRIVLTRDVLPWTGSDPIIEGLTWPDATTYTVSATGVWGRSSHTAPAGALVGAINDTVLALVCSDSGLIGVGDALLIGSEQFLVTDRAMVDTTATLNGALTKGMSETLVPIDVGSKVLPGEVVTVDAERMYVEDVTGNALVVVRQYDGSTLAAHNTATALYAPRSLRVARAQGKGADGTGGTTAASHSDGDLIAVYLPPEDVRNAVLARSIATIEQEQAGYGRVVGTGEGARPYSGKAVADEWKCVVGDYIHGRFYVV